MKRKICVVTGTRAEYGLLYWLMKAVQSDEELDLQIVVTGMHLSPEFGLTYRTIESDGFAIDAKVEMLLSSDTAVGTAKSIGLGIIGFADALENIKPDLLVVLGDRFEILAAVQAALVAKIPVAHIAGGDSTEGAFDEAIRHSITKMSHLHFVTNEQSAKRVCQLGENPRYVYNVGNPGLDHLSCISLLSKAELEAVLKFEFRPKNLLITFHPATLDTESSITQFQQLLSALDLCGTDVALWFTYPNADPQSRALIAALDDFVADRKHAKAFNSMGSQRYLSLMSHVDAVIGNSSSGLYEAPSFKVPTVNIGDRQAGRLRAASVLDCKPEQKEILSSICKALSMNCDHVTNPYGDGHSSQRILKIIKAQRNYQSLLKKSFFEVNQKC